MAFLLMVFLTLVCLFRGWKPSWTDSPREVVVMAAAAVLLVALHAFWVSRRVCWSLRRDPSRRDDLLLRYERWRLIHQVALFTLYGLVLVGGWPWAVRQLSAWGIELLTLAPFLLAEVVTWLFFYDADRAAYRAAHRGLEADPFAQAWLEPRQVECAVEGPRAPQRPEPATPFCGRWTYLGFQLRQKLALVFIPVLLLIIRAELERLFSTPENWETVINLLGIAALAGVLIAMPLIIRIVLGLTPLPAGALRDRLLAASSRLGFRCSDILLWNTRSGMANAMVIGLVPWLRYVVFTDRLLEEFTEEEVEAVFGHELGHIRHRHMLYYLLFLGVSMLVLAKVAVHYVPWVLDLGGAWLAEYVPGVGLSSLGELLGPNGSLEAVPVVLLMLVYIFVVFGFLSRRCERQADVYGCRAVSCLDPECQGHQEQTCLPVRGRGLCPTGIRTFIRALEKVALVNGISRDKPGFLQSWQHSTIARRVAFLGRMLTDGEALPEFERRLLAVKAGLLLGMAGLLAGLVMLHGWGW